MNDKDKEAFTQKFTFWIDHYPSDRLNDRGLYELMKTSWQAACEYKQKEIDNLRKVSDMEGYISSEYRRIIHEVLNSSNPNGKLSPNDAKFLLNQLLEMAKKPVKSITESSPETYLKMKSQREKLQAENAELRKCIKQYADLFDKELALRIAASQLLHRLEKHED